MARYMICLDGRRAEPIDVLSYTEELSDKLRNSLSIFGKTTVTERTSDDEYFAVLDAELSEEQMKIVESGIGIPLSFYRRG